VSVQVIVDERCVLGVDDPNCLILRDVCAANGFPYLVNRMPTASSGLHREDGVGLVSLGLSAAALGVGILQLLAARKEVTERDVLAEIDAFLRLRGITDTKFTLLSGVENLRVMNGQPCVVLVETVLGEQFRLYVGITGAKLFISPVLYNWRALT
jgi:hypothetical protein